MGLFSKQGKVDYDALFKEQYKSLNQLMMQVHNELDYVIKEALLEVVIKKYDELIEYIDQGVNQDKNHFISLKESALKELEIIRNINKD